MITLCEADCNNVVTVFKYQIKAVLLIDFEIIYCEKE